MSILWAGLHQLCRPFWFWRNWHLHTIEPSNPYTSHCCCSVTQSCPTLCDPVDCSTPVLHHLLELTQTHVHQVGDASNHLILCHPLLPPPSIFPSIGVFFSESTLRIRWPKYWSFSFSISPSNDYSGLISFRMDWLDLLAVQETLKIFSNTTVQKHQFFTTQLSLKYNSHIHAWLLAKLDGCLLAK